MKNSRHSKRMMRGTFAWLSSDVLTRLECDVIDRSEGGVKLWIDPDLEIGNGYSIELVPHTGAKPARLVWRRGPFAGFEFSE